MTAAAVVAAPNDGDVVTAAVPRGIIVVVTAAVTAVTYGIVAAVTAFIAE